MRGLQEKGLRVLCGLCVICSGVVALGDSRTIDTMDGIFDPNVKTVRTSVEGDYFALPMAIIGTDEVIDISFDDLAEDRDYFRYRVVRCDADWQPSTLAEVEYLPGFNESLIEDYAYSRGTIVHYVNYRFCFPNEDICPTLSGNYLVQVYREDEPEMVVFQKRVMLSEQCAPIAVSVTSRTDIDYNEAHQQLSVAVDTERAGVSDAYNDLIVMVSQNGRYDNEVALQHPLRMSGRTAIYEHQQPLIFPAGNEYRRFEVSSVTYPGMGVDFIEYRYPYYHFYLYTDESRPAAMYTYDSTQHGRFFVREYNSDESDVEADYVMVHFSLDYPPHDTTFFFLDGDFTSRRFDPTSMMVYNISTQRYEKDILLKQGAYNYQYLTVLPGATQGVTSVIEGDKYQTVNEYVVKVYARGPLDRSDRLIGVTIFSTAQ